MALPHATNHDSVPQLIGENRGKRYKEASLETPGRGERRSQEGSHAARLTNAMIAAARPVSPQLFGSKPISCRQRLPARILSADLVQSSARKFGSVGTHLGTGQEGIIRNGAGWSAKPARTNGPKYVGFGTGRELWGCYKAHFETAPIDHSGTSPSGRTGL
jgi:hypothetical protein